MSEEVEARIGRSHLIFESKSMGMILRYVIEREYDIEIDFSDSVPMRINGGDGDFCFSELETLKKDRNREMNNGTIRCTLNSRLHVCEEGGVFSGDTWEPIHGMMTNVGLFRYDPVRPHESIPKIMRLHKLEVVDVKGTYKGKRHVFKLKYVNDKQKDSEKYFSVDDSELYPVWLNKMRQTIKEYREIGAYNLVHPDDRKM